MSLLFDVSPENPTRKRAPQKRTGAPQSVSETVSEKTPSYIGNCPTRQIPVIGTIDHTYDCADGACGTQCHDIVHEAGGEWYLTCAFCGTSQWAKAIKGHLQPKAAEFVFRDGRFAGMTLPEAAAQPRGLDYIAMTAKSHKRPAVREACQAHLDRPGGTR
jgi:hypothetical protein